MYIEPLRLLAIGAFAALTRGDEQQRRTTKRPNIVVLFADNLAYDDVGAFAADPPGEESSTPSAPSSATPRLDDLASKSLLFRQWTSPAVLCSASRAALLTGRYPIRSGVYPRVFEPDAAAGLPPDEVTLAEHLSGTAEAGGYATKIVGKWHLGHREGYLPTDRGFDSWFGIPYHVSGGSVDGHECGDDVNGTRWLPLFLDDKIAEQPVRLDDLARRYASEAESFIEENARAGRPFFLYLPFSHVHQLCAPRHDECQWSGPPFSRGDGASYHSDFKGSVREMDWIAGRVLDALRSSGVEDDTLVLFTSDNGPWVAEGPGCAGSKGPFEGRWLKDNVDEGCTACPSEYVHEPSPGRPRRCVYRPPQRKFQGGTGVKGSEGGGSGNGFDDERRRLYEDVDGVHCGEDSGLGSAWEANVRVPALVRWPGGGVPSGAVTDELVSTLDVLPTVMGMLGMEIPDGVDGIDASDVWRGGGYPSPADSSARPPAESGGRRPPIFYWRDGFSSGPLPPPYGRFDVVAVRMGRIKAWIYTKSAHYNPDREVYHDPPLLFDVVADPAESEPLDPERYAAVARRAKELAEEHKAEVDWRGPLTLRRDPKFLPCADREAKCRTWKKGDGDAVEHGTEAIT